MPKTAITATVEQTATTEIAPELATKLASMIGYYNDLKLEASGLDDAMAAERAKILAAMVEAGIEKAIIENTPISIVRGYTKRLDKVKFVQLGGSLAHLDNATSSKPKKAYVKIGAEKEEEAA